MMDLLAPILRWFAYWLLRMIAQLTWGLDAAGLYVVTILDDLRRALVTKGFTRAIDEVAKGPLNLNRSLLELSITLFLILVMLTPAISFKWINIRKVIFLGVFLIPIGLPLLAGSFQDIDGARGDLADTYYRSIFNSATGGNYFGTIGGDAQGGNGADRDMGALVPFGSSDRGLRGVDVAAAYLFTSYEDVTQNRELPSAFVERYFKPTDGEFNSMPEGQQLDQLRTSTRGVVRTLFGAILVLSAFIELLIDLAFTLALGFQLIVLIVSLIFAFFTPFEGMTIAILRKIAELFLQSWTISAILALIVAAQLTVAQNGSGIAVLGMGIAGLALEGVFLMVAYKAVLSAVTGFGGAGINTFEATKALAPAMTMAAAPLSIAGGLAGAAGAVGGAVGSLAGGIGKTAAGLGIGRMAGGSWAAGAGYALSTTGVGRAVGALAFAMNGGENDVARGMYAGAVLGKGNPASIRGMVGLNTMAQEQRTERQRAEDAEVNRREHAYHAQQKQTAPPARSFDAAQISESVARMGFVGDPIQGSASGMIASQWATHGSIWGKSASTVDRVVETARQQRHQPDQLQRMILESMTEGRIRPDTRANAVATVQKLNPDLTEHQAQSHINQLEQAAKGLPSVVTETPVGKSAAPTVDEVMQRSPFGDGQTQVMPPATVPPVKAEQPVPLPVADGERRQQQAVSDPTVLAALDAMTPLPASHTSTADSGSSASPVIGNVLQPAAERRTQPPSSSVASGTPPPAPTTARSATKPSASSVASGTPPPIKPPERPRSSSVSSGTPPRPPKATP